MSSPCDLTELRRNLGFPGLSRCTRPQLVELLGHIRPDVATVGLRVADLQRVLRDYETVFVQNRLESAMAALTLRTSLPPAAVSACRTAQPPGPGAGRPCAKASTTSSSSSGAGAGGRAAPPPRTSRLVPPPPATRHEPGRGEPSTTPLCQCRLPAGFYQVKTRDSANFGRPYWACRRARSDTLRCHYFSWADEINESEHEDDWEPWTEVFTAEDVGEQMQTQQAAGQLRQDPAGPPQPAGAQEELADPGLPGLLQAVQRLAVSSPLEIREAATALLTRGMNPQQPGIQYQVARLLETAWEVTNPDPPDVLAEPESA